MDKDYFLGFSTLMNSSIVADLAFAVKNGFNAISIELSWNPKLELSNEEINILKKFSSDGNKIVFHMPFFTPTNSSIPEVGKAVISYFKKAINLAKEISAESITFHSGYVEQIGNKKTNKYLIENVKEILKYAKEVGVRLSIENDDLNGEYPLWKEDNILDVLASVKGLNFTFDPGHANTAKIDIEKFFENVSNYTDIIHLHNNNGKDTHESLDQGSIDYRKILPKFVKKKKIIFIFELFPHEKILKNKEILMNYLKNN